MKASTRIDFIREGEGHLGVLDTVEWPAVPGVGEEVLVAGEIHVVTRCRWGEDVSNDLVLPWCAVTVRKAEADPFASPHDPAASEITRLLRERDADRRRLAAAKLGVHVGRHEASGGQEWAWSLVRPHWHPLANFWHPTINRFRFATAEEALDVAATAIEDAFGLPVAELVTRPPWEWPQRREATRGD